METPQKKRGNTSTLNIRKRLKSIQKSLNIFQFWGISQKKTEIPQNQFLRHFHVETFPCWGVSMAPWKLDGWQGEELLKQLSMLTGILSEHTSRQLKIKFLRSRLSCQAMWNISGSFYVLSSHVPPPDCQAIWADKLFQVNTNY